MRLAKKILGPASKHDRNLPYTYKARVTPIEGVTDIYDDCISDTICGLLDYLQENDVSPEEVRLFGIYRGREIPLDIAYCTDAEGNWLERPEICHSLEQHFQSTLEEQYRGHVEHGPCSFEDRERKGIGPY